MSEPGGGGGWIRWAIAGVIVPILVALIGAGVFHWGQPAARPPVPPPSPSGQGPPTMAPEPGSAAITLSRATASRGSKLTVYGTGFRPGELVEIQIQDTTVATVTANSQGQFTKDITIPNSAPPPGFRTSVVATSENLTTATAPFSTT